MPTNDQTPVTPPVGTLPPTTPIATPVPPSSPSKEQLITPSKKVLIVLGLLELVFPSLALYMAFPLFQLYSSLKASNPAPHIGLIFFSVAWLTAIAQLVVGLLNLEMKIGGRLTNALIIIGIICSVLILPAMIIFLINPIYSLAGSS